MAKYLDDYGLGYYDGKIKNYINTKLTPVYKFQGTKTVAEINAMPSSILLTWNGYVYNVSDAGTITIGSQGNLVVNAGDNVVILTTGTAQSYTFSFDKLAGTVDLSGYLQKNGFETSYSSQYGYSALQSYNDIIIQPSAPSKNVTIGATAGGVLKLAQGSSNLTFTELVNKANTINGATITSTSSILELATLIKTNFTSALNTVAHAIVNLPNIAFGNESLGYCFVTIEYTGPDVQNAYYNVYITNGSTIMFGQSVSLTTGGVDTKLSALTMVQSASIPLTDTEIDSVFNANS